MENLLLNMGFSKFVIAEQKETVSPGIVKNAQEPKQI
jgi:hypothetical protein